MCTEFGKRMTHRKWIRRQTGLHWLVMPRGEFIT